MNIKLINSFVFNDLFPYPLEITGSDWSKLPEWQRVQIIHDNNNVQLNHNFRLEGEDLKNKIILFNLAFKKSTLLSHTPSTRVLPNSRFEIHSDVYNIIHNLGGSLTLFKFINKTNKNSPTYKSFEQRVLTKFENYIINMEITLVKSSKTFFTPKTFDVKTEEFQTLSLPIISEDYSHYIWHKSNRECGTNSAYYWQNIYFPMMLELGYANYDKYEAYNKKFDQENNPGCSPPS